MPSVRAVWLLLAAGLLVRLLLVAYYTPRQAWTGDPAFYLDWGRELHATGRYQRQPETDKMPAMSALVALGCALGPAGCRWLPLALFAGVGTAVAGGLWWLLAPWLRPRARLPALVLLLFASLEPLLFVIRLLPDLPAMALGVAAVAILSGELDSPRPLSARLLARAGLAGGALGTALYLRPDYLAAGLALAAVWGWLVRSRRGWQPAVAATMVMVTCMLLLLVPWGLRNHALGAGFRVFSDHGDRVLWWAFNDRRALDWVAGGEPWHGHPPAEQGTIARREAWRWVRANPADAAFLTASRIVAHVDMKPPDLISAAANQLPRRAVRWPYRILTRLLHELWVVGGLAALALGWRALPPALTLLATFAVARLLVPGALLPDGGRYGLIVVPFLACCAIWFVGRRDAPPPARSLRAAWPIAIVVIAIQVLFHLRWGW